MANEKRQSYIEKKLEFVINVGNYESLRVGTSFGETIEWSSPEERQKKLDAMTKSIAKEVSKDAQEIMIGYGLKRVCSSNANSNSNSNVKKEFNELNDINDSADSEDEEIKI